MSEYDKVNEDVFGERFETKLFGLSVMQFVHLMIGIGFALPVFLLMYFGGGYDINASLMVAAAISSPVLINGFITNDDKIPLFTVLKWRYKNNQRGAIVYRSTQTVDEFKKKTNAKREEEDKLLGIEPEKSKPFVGRKKKPDYSYNHN